MARLKRHEIPESRGINTTPMMDVIFQLLIFFVLTSSLTKPTQIELNLPDSTSGTKATSEKTLVVSYQLRDGLPLILLDNQPVASLDELEAQMKARAAGAAVCPVDIRIEKTVPYQDVIAVMDTVRDAGYPKFSLLTMARPKTGI
ncbi:MAG: biopolymer transporter ExbD [Verrucomicrobia bacterium]|nr:biopolymer transporter ExbD [Verrucomicrobiota bacterium]MBU4365641.1 biopolymer transporter ExbD [Verrucomicrobiota bacterium]